MDVHAEVRRASHEAALRAVQKPTAKPWRGGTGAGAPPPPPPKVYRVEPREFRDLVQRLTGAPPAARRQHGQQLQHPMAAVQPQQPMAVRASAAAAGGEDQHQMSYAPWFSFPMVGLDAHHHGNGALM